MNKWLKGLLILFGILACLVIIARFTGMLLMHRIPTPSSEPNIPIGSTILVTNLKSPKRGDFVIYTESRIDSFLNLAGVETKSGTLYMHRLCGRERDKIQMKNGVLYVNGIDVDAEIDLCHLYSVPKRNSSSIPDDILTGAYPAFNDSEIVVNLSKKQVKEFSSWFPVTIYHIPADTSSNAAFSWLDKKLGWTPDDFGPLTIPEGCGFVMGDNRNNSLDSRYLGFIKLSNIEGVKL